MGNLQLNDISLRQLLAMGDGLMQVSEISLARDVYNVALRRTSAEHQQPIRTRLGLANAPNNRTLWMLGLLKQLEKEGWANPFVSDGMATWLKTLPFQNDQKFQELADKHSHLLPIANWHWNLQGVLWAVQHCKDVEGDYIELGVFKGHTTLFCAEYCDFANWPKTWWLYDTFVGIPVDQQAPGWEEINRRTYTGRFSYEEVSERFAPIPNIKVIKGRVPEILADRAPDKIAFMHIDLNNAPAEIGALEVLFDRVTRGGVIIFDDYTWDSTRAQFKAEKAWFDRRGLHILPLPTGQGVFIK